MYCAGMDAGTRLPSRPRHSLADADAQLTAEWHPTKNAELTPAHVTPGSGKRVRWRDERGHEWQATVNNRSHGTGCPYCSNTRVLAGFNDPAEKHGPASGHVPPIST